MALFHFRSTAEHGHGHGTAVERLDPRVKLGLAVALAVWIGLLPLGREVLLAFVAVGLVVVAALAQIPPGVVAWRAAGALPFVLIPLGLGALAGTLDPHRLLGMAARGYTAAMVATVLVSVTPFSALLAAASALGCPDVLVATTALVYRYLSVLRERAAATMASARARGFSSRSPERLSTAGAMLGALLLGSLDRADRVHAAMLARGWTGRFVAPVPLRMRGVDWVVLGAGLGLLAAWRP